MNADHEPADAPALLLTNPERPRATRPSGWSIVAWLAAIAWAAMIYLLSAQANLAFFPAEDVDFVFTKIGHLVIFGVIALLLWRALLSIGRLHRPWAWALALTVVFAITDELHQASVPGREASLRDVAIDTVGA